MFQFKTAKVKVEKETWQEVLTNDIILVFYGRKIQLLYLLRERNLIIVVFTRMSVVG